MVSSRVRLSLAIDKDSTHQAISRTCGGSCSNGVCPRRVCASIYGWAFAHGGHLPLREIEYSTWEKIRDETSTPRMLSEARVLRSIVRDVFVPDRLTDEDARATLRSAGLRDAIVDKQ